VLAVIDAGAHAWAARGGSYSSLTDWQVGANGALEGRITLPLKVGTVGGSLQANPGAELGLAIAGVSGAGELAALMAAVGLAQNFAALRALVTHGIQRGHMRLHARSVASTAAVPAAIFDRVVAAMIESGDINVSTARELTARLSASRAPVKDAASSESRSGYGVAAGKVILLGEHAAVYDKHVLALPLLDAVSARVEEKGHELEVHLVELGRDRGADLGADSGGGIAAAIELMLDSLDVRSRGFRIVVESRVPAAMGLGSSAAFAVAIIRAFDDFYELRLDDDRVNALAFDCEKLAHGTPSGIDNTLATFARPVLYRRSASPTTRALSLDEQPPVVVAASGTRGMTRDQVSGVRQRYERQPRLFSRIFDEIDANVGGETASVVGEKIRQIAAHRQAICVSHLAPVAAAADCHFVVSKSVRQGRTLTDVSELGKSDRVRELARMLGGQGEAQKRHARALLKNL